MLSFLGSGASVNVRPSPFVHVTMTNVEIKNLTKNYEILPRAITFGKEISCKNVRRNSKCTA